MPLLYVIAQPWNHMYWNRGPGPGGGGWWIAHLIFMLLIAALVILAIVWLVRSLSAGPGRRHGEPTALEVLDRRFAEGTISVEEYNERRRILGGGPAPGG
jgi:putative membrane protein